MRRLLFASLALLAAVLVFARPVHAQNESSYYYGEYYGEDVRPKPITLHAGAGFLAGTTKVNTVPVVGFDVEVPLVINRLSCLSFVDFSVDWMPIQTLEDETVNVFPALINYRQYGIIGAYRVYLQLGAGARWASNDIPELEINQGAQFEWSIGVGIDLTRTFIAQARYLAGNDPKEDAVIVAELGYRF